MKQLFVLLLVITLLTGCDKLGIGGETPPGQIQAKDICTTNEGVDFSFERNLPPSEVIVNEPFYVSFIVENKGCSDVDGAFLSLQSRDRRYLQFDKTYFEDIELMGKDASNPYGDFKTFTLEGTAIGMDEDKNVDQTIIAAKLCYAYKTTAQAEVCIVPRRSGPVNTRDDVCAAGYTKLDRSQGGPVVVTNIETKTIDSEYGRKIQFNIFVANQGKGLVYDEKSETCIGEPLIRIGEVSFADYSSTGEGANTIHCAPEVLKIDPKTNNMFKCTADLYESKGAYTTPLIVELSYGYTITRTKSVAILREIGSKEAK